MKNGYRTVTVLEINNIPKTDLGKGQEADYIIVNEKLKNKFKPGTDMWAALMPTLSRSGGCLLWKSNKK